MGKGWEQSTECLAQTALVAVGWGWVSIDLTTETLKLFPQLTAGVGSLVCRN